MFSPIDTYSIPVNFVNRDRNVKSEIKVFLKKLKFTMKHELKFVSLVAFLSLVVVLCSAASNDLEESEEENEKDSILNYSALENPFRVQKINLLWEKAR